jgi:hypothetical protein
MTRLPSSAATIPLQSESDTAYNFFRNRNLNNCRDRNIIDEIEGTTISPPDASGASAGTGGDGIDRSTDTGGPNIDPTGELTPDEEEQTGLDLFGAENNTLNLDSILQQFNFGSSLGISQEQFMSLGKSVLIINSGDFGTSTSILNQNFSLDEPLVLDRIKYFYNSFYSLEPDNNIILYKSKSDARYLFLNRTTQEIVSSDTGQNGLNFPVIKDTIYLLQGDGLKTPEDTVDLPAGISKEQYKAGILTINNQILRSIIEGKKYEGIINYQQKERFSFKQIVPTSNGQPFQFNDDTFRINLPFENTDILKNINLVGASIVDIKDDYNFYIKEYEKIAINSNVNSNERSFPNLYILMDFIEKNNNNSVVLNSLLTNGQHVPLGNPLYILNGIDRTLDVARTSRILLGQKNPVGQYFDDFGRTYDSLKQQNSDLFNTFENKNKNIIFLTDAISRLSIMNEKKNMFPMSVEIKFPTDKSSSITKMFYNSQLMDNLIVLISSLYNTNSLLDKEVVYSEKIMQQNIQQTTNINSQPVNSTFASGTKNIKEYLLNDIIQILMDRPIPQNNSDYLLIGDTNGHFERTSDLLGIINNLRRIMFQGQLMTFLKTNCRNYKEILLGKTAYNETVLYRITKYSQEEGEQELTEIQNYWIPNTIDEDFLTIIDTQIKYQKNYTYKIFAYQIVAGTSYTQEVTPIIDTRESRRSLMKAEVLWQANPKIVEVELLTFNRRIVDSPPLSPEIEFVPYQNIDNKIGLFLNTRVGKEDAEVINILDQDINKTNLYKKDSNNLVSFATDDLIKRFEIMKLDKKPKNYSDFKTGYIKTVQTEPDVNNPLNTVASSFIDDIEPNKKYYYCFRSVDVHENISNPSEIYEVQIINENGMIYPIVKLYEFEKPAFKNSIEMRRFIKIKPQLQHYLVNSEDPVIVNSSTASDAVNTVKLGVSNVGVPWDKPFKLVATSKQTGRKIEIKFKFKYIVE